jgi:hypothetical protein
MPSLRRTTVIFASVFFLPLLTSAAIRRGSIDLSNLPTAAQSTISAAVGRRISDYRVKIGTQDLEATNSSQKLATHFTSDGVEVRSGNVRWTMALRGYGYGDAIQSVGANTPHATLNRVEYGRGPLTEWYVNGPLGLEQGFTIAQPPGYAHGQLLTLAIDLAGNVTPVIDESRTGLKLIDQMEAARLRYSGLVVTDATGKQLPSRLELRDSRLLIRVKDAYATYPVVIDPVIQVAELTPSTRANNDWFGVSVGVSGNTVVVGAFDSNIEQTGTAYVFVKPATGWTNMTETATLTPSDAGAGFGTSVAISGNTIVVGAANASNLDRQQSSGPGAAYVFVKPASGWVNMTETAKLTASDGASGDAFGNSVSISGNMIAVGAIFAHNFAGQAYVFVEPAGGWSGNLTQTAELTASDSAILNYMGASVSISGNTVVVGANGHNNFQGSAYVFVQPSGGWINMTETAELTASDGKASDGFGFSVGISGDTAVIGAPSSHNFQGTAYVFVKPATGWVTTSTFNAELGVPHAVQSGGFAQSVSISGNAVAIGSPGTTVGTNSNQGAVFLFVKPASGWVSTSKPNAELIASDGGANDDLGVSVGITGSTIVGGATKSDKPGEAYVFGH